jgi:hypothetical protein
MMDPEKVLGFPPRPPSEVEWEELLLRLEIMPRAIMVLVEELPTAGGRGAREAGDLLLRERRVRDYLERAAELPPSPSSVAEEAESTPEKMEHFVRLRARNFAIVQRRGLEVWDWAADIGAGRAATVHQVLRALAEEDAATLAAVRRLIQTGPGVC